MHDLPLTAEARPVQASPSATLRAWIARELHWRQVLRLGAVTVQLTLLVAAIRLLNIETRAFEKVLMLALGGFLIHHFLPLPQRLPFFAILSVASVFVVFGLPHGAWLLGLGALLIGLCHLPVSMFYRVGLILWVAIALALARLGSPWLPEFLQTALPGTIWPILGAMFMFRLSVYLYDLHHRTAPFSASRAAAYFFMLPNVCFPLFPVVDYRTFCRNHFNDDAIRIYQIGTKWIFRGLVQLLIYRWIYMHAMIAPDAAVTALDTGQYMLTTFLLYLKISGLFHVIIGLLHMFGFNLPETHHLYLFSSSFTDFWRRINIYWKDFVMKLVFYPLLFRWKKWRPMGESRAVALATLTAFAATWLLHSYQWFWIRGTFPIEWSDLVFWLGLGVVVLLNIQWEQRRGRQRVLKKAARTWRSELGLLLRTAGTFSAICVLWTIWSTPNIGELRHLAAAAANFTLGQLAIIAAVPLGIGAAGVLLGRRTREHTEGLRATALAQPDHFWRSASLTTCGAAAIIALTVRPEMLLLGPAPRSWRQAGVQFIADVRSGQLNRADQQALQRGYYEDLGDVTRFNNELWQLYGQAPPNWGNFDSLVRDRDDVVLYEYLPSLKTPFRGALFTTNRHGMRDREYDRPRAVGVFRLALVGSSHDAGSGVDTHQTYENLLEDSLNQQLAPAGMRVEVLNFSVRSYGPLNKLAAIEQVILDWEPDVILYVAHNREIAWSIERTPLMLWERGLVAEFPFLAAVFHEAGIDLSGPILERRELERKLEPFAHRILAQVFEQFGVCSRQRGVRPVILLSELPADVQRPETFDDMINMGRQAGIEVIDLYGVFAGVPDRSKLKVAPWDDHTNALGHALIAPRLLEQLVHRGLVPPGESAVVSTDEEQYSPENTIP